MGSIRLEGGKRGTGMKKSDFSDVNIQCVESILFDGTVTYNKKGIGMY